MGTVGTREKTVVKIKSVGAVIQDARERVVPLVVSNGSSEGRVERGGGHEHGPLEEGPVDGGVAREQPSSVLVPGAGRGDSRVGTRVDRRDERCERLESDAGRRAGPATVDEQSSRGIIVGGSKGREASSETPVLVHQWRDQEAAALDLHSIGGESGGLEVVRSKRARNGCSSAAESVGETLLERRGLCSAQRQSRSSSGGISGRHHAENARRCTATAAAATAAATTAANNRSCRVHGRRRDRPRGKATEQRHPVENTRDLTSNEYECSVIRLEQDPILEPVRILGCPPSEGLEISSFLEPAPSYVYQGINVGRLAGNEAACFSLYDPNNILPKSRAGSIAKILEGPNRAVKDINRKVLAMARAMTPAWSLRLLGVSCGSVVCAWGLLLILSVLGGGASHGTALGSFGLGSLSGAMEDMNSARCPWLCMCTGQEVDCSHRGLTQIPGDLVTFLVAEKL